MKKFCHDVLFFPMTEYGITTQDSPDSRTKGVPFFPKRLEPLNSVTHRVFNSGVTSVLSFAELIGFAVVAVWDTGFAGAVTTI